MASDDSARPVMDENRAVRFASQEQFAVEYLKYIKEGGVFVRGDVLPDLLDDIDIELVLPDSSGDTVKLRGQVTSRNDDRALIRFVSLSEESRQLLASAAERGAEATEDASLPELDLDEILSPPDQLATSHDAGDAGDEGGTRNPESGEVADLCGQLQEDLEQLQMSDHFERVGAQWSDHPNEINECWKGARKRYEPGSVGHLADPETCKNILGLLGEAHETLQDPELRAQYRRTVVEEAELTEAAERAAQRGEVYFNRGDANAAREWLEFAVELSPTPKRLKQLEVLRGAPCSP